jgi:hypothetical protein
MGVEREMFDLVLCLESSVVWLGVSLLPSLVLRQKLIWTYLE